MSAIASLIAPLFVPANQPERFAKAAASGADAVIVDLEDAVPPEAKEYAREALSELPRDIKVLVRVNGCGTPWHNDDLAALEGTEFAAIMLPKAESVADLAKVAALAPVIALVETARGLAQARALAQSGYAVRLAFGSVDYAADIGCSHTRVTLLAARSELVLASRLGGLPPPLDGVTTDIESDLAVSRDAAHARGLGFGGKLLIHPRQVTPTRRAFTPSATEITWANRVLQSGQGAVRVDGQMVDEPVRICARSILARAVQGQ